MRWSEEMMRRVSKEVVRRSGSVRVWRNQEAAGRDLGLGRNYRVAAEEWESGEKMEEGWGGGRGGGVRGQRCNR